MIIFTICSNNYLAQAIVLGNSVNEKNPEYTFQIFLCDVKNSEIDYSLIKHEIIEISKIEPHTADMAMRYNIIELNTAVKPTVFQYILNKKSQEKAIYLDPDTCVFDSLAFLEDELNHNSIILTPHILTQIPLDYKEPNENLFLNYGIYNLGFLGLKNDQNSTELLKWWKQHTYTNGYIQPAFGIFVDQLPMNLTPIFFNNVKTLIHFGLNMAPWNLHERILSKCENGYKVNNVDNLIFYHFSSFKVNKNELPKSYNRYKLLDRPDLRELYQKYNDKILKENFLFFTQIKPFYTIVYEEALKRNEKINWEQASIFKKTLIYLKKNIPISIKNKFK